MTPAIQKNLISGGGLMLFGALYAFYAVTQLQIGTFSSMGPGMFPMLVGIVLVITGGFITGPALREWRARTATPETAGKWETVEIKPLLLVLAAMGSFALLLEPFGVAVSAFALVGISALASNKLTFPLVLAISAVLTVSTYVIFIWALKMPLDLWKWPL